MLLPDTFTTFLFCFHWLWQTEHHLVVTTTKGPVGAKRAALCPIHLSTQGRVHKHGLSHSLHVFALRMLRKKCHSPPNSGCTDTAEQFIMSIHPKLDRSAALSNDWTTAVGGREF